MTCIKNLACTTTLANIVIVFIFATGTAKAQQTAPVNVKVVNTPAVKNQDDGARQPVALGVGVDFNNSSRATGMPVTMYTVPAGKRLVLEFWSAEVHVPIGQRAFTRIEGCASNDIFLPLGDPFSGGSAAVNLQVNGGLLKAYCNPGDRLDINVEKSFSSGSANAGEITFFGHLVNLP
jgi:hypothetical protein